MGTFRNGTTAHLPENFPTPSSTAKVDLDWPPMTGSLVTCHLWSVAEPSKVASTTGDCAESAGASGEGEREAHVQTTARREDRGRGAVWVWAYPGREGERRESRGEHLLGRRRFREVRFCKLRCHVTAGVALPADEVVAQGGFKRTSSRVHLYKADFFQCHIKSGGVRLSLLPPVGRCRSRPLRRRPRGSCLLVSARPQ